MRIALVGCGRIARLLHGPILSRIADVRVTALVDPDPGARIAMAQILPGAVLCGDIETALAAAEVDAVVICTPPAHHAAPAIAAMEAGLPVYVEKPLAAEAEAAAEMIAVRDRTGMPAMVGHNFRFHPAIAEARRALAAGEYGDLLGIRSFFASERRALPSWKLVRGGGGDALGDLGGHHLDLFAHLSGQAVREDSVTAAIRETGEGSIASLCAALEGGAPLSLTVSQVTGASANRLELLCGAGHVEIDLIGGTPPRLSRPPGRRGRIARLTDRAGRIFEAADIRSRPDPSFERALRHFARVAARPAEGIGETAPSLEDGLRAMRLTTVATQARG